jgi:hypothetical protein
VPELNHIYYRSTLPDLHWPRILILRSIGPVKMLIRSHMCALWYVFCHSTIGLTDMSHRPGRSITSSSAIYVTGPSRSILSGILPINGITSAALSISRMQQLPKARIRVRVWRTRMICGILVVMLMRMAMMVSRRNLR